MADKYGYTINGVDISSIYDRDIYSGQPVASSGHRYNVKGSEFSCVKYNSIYTGSWEPAYLIDPTHYTYTNSENDAKQDFFTSDTFAPINTNIRLSVTGKLFKTTEPKVKLYFDFEDIPNPYPTFKLVLTGTENNTGHIDISVIDGGGVNVSQIFGMGHYDVPKKYVIVGLVGAGGQGAIITSANLKVAGGIGGSTAFCILKFPDNGKSQTYYIDIGYASRTQMLEGGIPYYSGSYNRQGDTSLFQLNDLDHGTSVTAKGGRSAFVWPYDTFDGGRKDNKLPYKYDNRQSSGVYYDNDVENLTSIYARPVATSEFMNANVVNTYSDLEDPYTVATNTIYFVEDTKKYYINTSASNHDLKCWMPFDPYSTEPKLSDITVVPTEGDLPQPSDAIDEKIYYVIGTDSGYQGYVSFYRNSPNSAVQAHKVNESDLYSIYTYHGLEGHFGSFATFNYSEKFLSPHICNTSDENNQGAVLPAILSRTYAPSAVVYNSRYLSSGGSSFFGGGALYNWSSEDITSVEDLKNSMSEPGFGGGGLISYNINFYSKKCYRGGDGAAFLYW